MAAGNNPKKSSCVVPDLRHPGIDAFDRRAKEVAHKLAAPQGKGAGGANRSTQLRKFYDEFAMWQQKSSTAESLKRNLPFIKMLNAKVEYARSRGHVDDQFVEVMADCLKQIDADYEQGVSTLYHSKLFFEAVLGFHKAKSER